MIPQENGFLVSFNIGRHRALQLGANQLFGVIPENVATDTSRQLQDENNDHEHGKGQHHAVVFPNCTTASEERNDEDDYSDGDEESGHGKELVR